MNLKSQKGSALIIGLVAVIVVGVGLLAYFSGQMTGKKAADADGNSVAEAVEQAAAQVPEQPATIIEPGNPVVGKVNGQDITRLDVFNFIQTLPAQTQQQPVSQLFPFALEQVINSVIVNEKVQNVNLDNDPQVREQLEAVKQQIVRTVYLQQEVEKGLTEERLQEAYALFLENQPPEQVPEAKARHILVEDAALARDLIKQINDGGDFEALAQEHSTDATAQTGGDLGYFAEAEVVPEFAQAAFALDIGSVTQRPVESQFGFHVIKLEEKRLRPPPTFEQSRAFLEGQLRRALLDNLVAGWRGEAEIQRFDINGAEVAATEPAAGEESEEEASE